MKRIGDIMREHSYIIVTFGTIIGLMTAAYLILCQIGYDPMNNLHDYTVFIMMLFPSAIIAVIIGIITIEMQIKREDKKKNPQE